jgi:glutamate N-acetyltransferase/amino-acid N-acetyltransferase
VTEVRRAAAGNVVYPQGFRSAVGNAGVKDETRDVSLVASDRPAAAAAVFTRSSFCGPAVVVGRRHVADGRLQAVLVVSKNANVATGGQGLRDTEELARLAATAAGVAPEDVLVCCTGVIGRPLPMERLRDGVAALGAGLEPGGLLDVAEAIMTTDVRPKAFWTRAGDAVVFGIAKGAGMIEPDMATLLAYVYTDAEVDAQTLATLTRRAADRSFNMTSVDTDTSTSDTLAVLANGAAGPVDIDAFEAALTGVCVELAKAVAREGEGVTKLIELTVRGAGGFDAAKRVGKSIIGSPLVKTAVFGCDPNWGRVAMAIGKTPDLALEQERVAIAIAGVTVYRGEPLTGIDLDAVSASMRAADTVEIDVDLGLGGVSAVLWGCDLSYDYVRINAEYTT